MSERCACGAFELDKVPSRQHGRSCTPGSPSSEYDRPCPVEWCRLLDGHGGLHLAIPEVQRLRAALAEAEARDRQTTEQAERMLADNIALVKRARAAEASLAQVVRERDLARELLNGDDVTAYELGKGRVVELEASLAQARAERDAARAGLENQARDYTRRCEQLAQARAERDRLNAAVLALQEGRAGAERALAQAREVLTRLMLAADLLHASVTTDSRDEEEVARRAKLLDAEIDKARALASALGRGEGDAR